MKDNFVLPLALAATICFVVLVFFMILFVMIAQRKRNRMKTEKQKAIFMEQERTMSEISKELHDNIGAFLNLAMMNVHVIKEAPLNNDQREAARNVGNIITQLISDVQHISHTMSSNYIRHRGLYDVLNGQLKYISASKRMKCSIDVRGKESMLHQDEQLLVYRIAQEAIQNTMKHAEATRLTILLDYAPSGFTMTISDNGQGFRQDKASGGIGLMDMQERAHLLNGTINITSVPGQGCTIELHILGKELKQ